MIWVVTLLLGAAPRHWPVVGLVSQSARLTGRLIPPVSAEAVMVSLAPTFTVATANTPVPVVPGIFTIPSLVKVAARATMSGIGLAEAESRSVLRPEITGAGAVFTQVKLSATSVGSNDAVGVKAKTKLWVAPAGISMGVLGVPVT